MCSSLDSWFVPSELGPMHSLVAVAHVGFAKGIIGCVALSVLFSFPALQRLPSLRQIAGFVWSPSVPTKIERHALAAFHKQMASMLVRLMPGILFFILVRFARIAVARDISFEVAPIDALDIPCLVMYLVGIVLLRFRPCSSNGTCFFGRGGSGSQLC